MTALDVILACVIVALVGLVAYLSLELVAALKRAATAETAAAQRVGELGLAAERMTEANAATTTAVAAEKAQEHRADATEKELADATASHSASDPADGLDRLQKLSDVPAAGDPSAITGPGGPKPG